MNGRLNWDRHGRDWPNRGFSRFVTAGGLRWHVQVMGDGPVVLLIHGTGASAHSFRALARLLATDCTVIIPDLPGHGFTDAPRAAQGYALPVVARGLSALLHELDLRPTIAVGHSAGAAVVVQMTLSGSIMPAAVVSLNGALLPFQLPLPGMANELFGSAARFLASTSLAANAFSLFAGSRAAVERMVRSTGSRIDAEGKDLYVRLAANSGHVHGALALMANWDLRPLAGGLPKLPARLVLVVGSRDGMVPPSEAYRVRALVPKAEVVSLRGLGHLAHEEKPAEIASLLQRMWPHEAAG